MLLRFRSIYTPIGGSPYQLDSRRHSVFLLIAGVVDGDSLESISELRKPSLVVKGGTIYRCADLWRLAGLVSLALRRHSR